METLLNLRKFTLLIGISSCVFLMMSSPLSAGITHKAKKDLKSHIEKLPWLGLIADEISYGPIDISNVHIHDSDKLVMASPGEILNGSLTYRIKAEDLSSLHLYHLVIGIKGDSVGQDCISHSLGTWDSQGKGNFKLKVPDKPGVYEVRFLLAEELTCQNARKDWAAGKNGPSAATTVGVIIVE